MGNSKEVVGNCRHTVEEVICSQSLVMENSIVVVVVKNCGYMVGEECYILSLEMVNMKGVVASCMVHTQQPLLP